MPTMKSGSIAFSCHQFFGWVRVRHPAGGQDGDGMDGLRLL
jgi:hypothetical protein